MPFNHSCQASADKHAARCDQQQCLKQVTLKPDQNRSPGGRDCVGGNFAVVKKTAHNGPAFTNSSQHQKLLLLKAAHYLHR